MASHPSSATALASSPVPRSRRERANSRVPLVCADHVVATVSAVAATAATAVAPETASAQGATASGLVRAARGGMVPAGGSDPSARRRRTTSATVVTADAATATPMSTFAPRPMPGVTGSSSLFATNGAMRLPTPMVRLAIVSASS
jgi:hypothetical protein